MKISNQIKQKVLERDQYKCHSCGNKLNKKSAQIEHIIPISKGGKNELSNLRTVCHLCNFSKVDKVLEIVTTPISKQFAEIWVKAFKKFPSLTSISSVIVAIISILIGINLYDISENKRSENINYVTQIQQLDETEQNLKQLIDYINLQRTNLKSNQDALESLKSEKKELEILVESDKKVVEALFEEQEKRNRAKIITERWIGIGLGVLASVIASTILMVIRIFLSKRKIQKITY